MSKPDTSIDPRILESAKAEFLSCGYEKASTNIICKKAGVTSGALYKRFAGKDELFCALVAPTAEEFKGMLSSEQSNFHAMSEGEKESAALGSASSGAGFIDYVYEHFDAFKLLIECSEGSSYGHYMEDMVEILVKSTEKFMAETNHEAVILGKEATHETIHILISSYLYGLFEPVVHGMNLNDALVYTEQLKYFFNVGWADILRLKKQMP